MAVYETTVWIVAVIGATGRALLPREINAMDGAAPVIVDGTEDDNVQEPYEEKEEVDDRECRDDNRS